MERVKRLVIHTPQGDAGELVRESQFVFNYRTENPTCEISLTMPLRHQSYAANILPGVLRQNLPEGYLKDWIQQRFGKTMKLDDIAIIAITGKNVIGRVSASLPGSEGGTRPLGESLTDILKAQGTEALFDKLAEKYAEMSGISGVQPKVVVPIATPPAAFIDRATMPAGEVIIKTGGDEYEGLAENEYHCMSIAAAAGITVPRFWLSDNKQLFIVERFDREEAQQLGFEDMTSLMGLQNEEKYDSSYENIAKAITLNVSEAHKQTSLTEFYKSLVLSVLLRNGDAHLKNFGLIYTTPQSDDCRLSPLYDVVNTTMYIQEDTLALKLQKNKTWPTHTDLAEFGRMHCGIDRPEQIIEQIATVAMEYKPAEATEIWARLRPEIERGCVGANNIQPPQNKKKLLLKP